MEEARTNLRSRLRYAANRWFPRGMGGRKTLAAGRMLHTEIYRSVFEGDGQACLLVEADRILDCNSKALSLLGCDREEIIGKSPREFAPAWQPDGSDSAFSFKQKIADAFDNGGLVFPWHHRRLDGAEFATEVSVCPLAGAGQQVALVRMRKLTRPATNDLDVTLSGTHAGHLPKLDSLSQMAGGLAHDFNNFLLAILGNADLLDRDLAAGKGGDELLNEIRKAAGRAADLCSQLLAYAGKGKSHFQMVDLSVTAQEMVQMLKVAISRKIALRLDLTSDLPIIEGDMSQIHQLIMNLVVNASEAIGNHHGTITLATGRTGCTFPGDNQACMLRGELLDGPLVYLEVRDDGPGMDEELQRRIFDPYFSTKIRGRGLGLATVLGTVRCHQGSLCLKTRPGEGTAIRVCFPAARLPRVELSGHLEAKAPANGHGTVLIVDDEEYLRVLCSRMMQRLGYGVLLASDGAQALEIYREHKGEIDAVILDLVMPVMDGVEVLERLLKLDPEAKVIMTSGYHEKEISMRFSGRGIAGFLQKPYVMSDLGGVLSRVIQVES
jgi:PAS domain S-box-containing protein